MASDEINLDVHAINELQKKGVPPTDDSLKYRYTADDTGNYCEYTSYVMRKSVFGVRLKPACTATEVS